MYLNIWSAVGRAVCERLRGITPWETLFVEAEFEFENTKCCFQLTLCFEFVVKFLHKINKRWFISHNIYRVHLDTEMMKCDLEKIKTIQVSLHFITNSVLLNLNSYVCNLLFNEPNNE